jgi:DNA-binding transcriptional regulator GbsR (MarR family)
VARSNVSNSLHELQGWGIVKVVHVMGDRRDHFESMKDVWEMFQIILDERKKRECDPTLDTLRELVEKAKAGGTKEAYTRDRLAGMLDFFESMSDWYQQIRRMPKGALLKFVKLGDKVRRLLA